MFILFIKDKVLEYFIMDFKNNENNNLMIIEFDRTPALGES